MWFDVIPPAMGHAPLLGVLAVTVSAIAACAASTADGSAAEASSELITLRLTCGSDGATFDLAPVTGGGRLEGKLSSGSDTSTFTCRAPDNEALAEGVVTTCTEREPSHDGRYAVTVRKTADAYEATLSKGGDAGPDVTMTCSIAEVPDSGANYAGPDFDVVEPILTNTCSGCHMNNFDTLSKVKRLRTRMLAKITAGEMPRGNPDWKDSPDGQTVLDFLQNSPTLH
jgi:hypothetical protein